MGASTCAPGHPVQDRHLQQDDRHEVASAKVMKASAQVTNPTQARSGLRKQPPPGGTGASEEPTPVEDLALPPSIEAASAAVSAWGRARAQQGGAALEESSSKGSRGVGAWARRFSRGAKNVMVSVPIVDQMRRLGERYDTGYSTGYGEGYLAARTRYRGPWGRS